MVNLWQLFSVHCGFCFCLNCILTKKWYSEKTCELLVAYSQAKKSDYGTSTAGILWIFAIALSVFQQQSGYVMCRRMVCDCENPTVDLFCCPECDPRLSSQCLHQSGELSYNSGESWIQNCQQCRCLVRLLDYSRRDRREKGYEIF